MHGDFRQDVGTPILSCAFCSANVDEIAWGSRKISSLPLELRTHFFEGHYFRAFKVRPLTPPPPPSGRALEKITFLCLPLCIVGRLLISLFTYGHKRAKQKMLLIFFLSTFII